VLFFDGLRVAATFNASLFDPNDLGSGLGFYRTFLANLFSSVPLLILTLLMWRQKVTIALALFFALLRNSNVASIYSV
jgi:hypothetical protein